MPSNKVLFIDDDETNNFLISLILPNIQEIETYKIITNGWVGLEYLNSAKSDFPNLIFIDLRMSEMDGMEFIERYESVFYKEFPETKIVVVSNSLNKSEKEKALNFPSVIQFMDKPLTEEKIKDLLVIYKTPLEKYKK